MEIDTEATTSISEFTSTKKLQDKIKNLPSKSYVVEGQEKDEIHNENLSKLQEMTEEQIIEEQKNLIDALDPEIVKFFKSKRKDDLLPDVKKKNQDIVLKEDTVEVDQIDTTKELIENADKWLHFDKIETEKLQWMKNIVIPKKPKDSDIYEARYENLS